MTNYLESFHPGLIYSGKNIYIKSGKLWNLNSQISSENNIFLTGKNFKNIRHLNPTDSGSGWFSSITENYSITNSPVVTSDIYYSHANAFGTFNGAFGRAFEVTDNNIEWYDWNSEKHTKLPLEKRKKDNFLGNTIVAKENIVVDFSDNIEIRKTTNESEYENKPEILKTLKSISILAKNILLHGKDISISDKIESKQELSVISENNITFNKADVSSTKNLSMTAVNEIQFSESKLKGDNIALISRVGDINFSKSKFAVTGFDTPILASSLNAKDNLTINAGRNLHLRDIDYFRNIDTSLTANGNIEITNLNPSDFESPQKNINSSNSISINSAGSIYTVGMKFLAGKDISLSARKDVNLYKNDNIPYYFLSRLGGELTAKNNINITSGNDIIGKYANIVSENDILLYSGGKIALSSVISPAQNSPEKQSISQLRSNKDITLLANGSISTEGASLSSNGNISLISSDDIYLNSALEKKDDGRVQPNMTSETHIGTELKSGNNITILANGGLLFQATKLLAKGVIDIAAKGGYLYAQAQEDVTEYTTSETKHKWYGKKKSRTVNHRETTNKVTEFVAGGDINLLSHDDSTYEASKIETNNNATLTSTHGKVNFKAVKNTVFDQTITESKGFFIKNGNSGYSAETWVLPSVHIGGKLTIDAANGISADIKTQKGQSLQAALAALGDTPETAWLKRLNQRQDVHWNEVQDAYESWDHKSQQLSPAASAVIAIAVAVVTAGAGVTVAAAGYAAGAATTVGASAATAAAVGGAVTAGMASLASTAAVKLINNGGNISKTLKEMGNSETVKSTATSMAIGGALAGFDNLIGVEKTANGATKAPLLSNKADWSKVAQRVAGQSVISSSLNTAINGGSFKDNFAAALLTNVGNQINAEGANIIGNNGAVLGAPGKAISHAAVSALAAEIGGGDAKGAAAGALAAELATVVMESSLFESKYRNEPERQFHKIQEAIQGNEAKAQTVQVIGALSGALISGTPEGVYSAANSADLVYRYNYTEHQWDQIFQENGRDIAAAASGDKAAAARVAARQDGAIAALAVAGGAYVTVAGGYILAAATEEMLFAGRMAFEACKVQGSFCINKMGIFVADAMAPEAALGTGALGVGTVKILGYSSESAKNLANELNHASTALLSKNQKPNTYAVTGLIEQEAKRALENYRVYDLNKVTDKALDLNLVRQETLKYLKASHQKNDKAVSYATASVDTNGITEYYLSVSGKAWSGSSPTTVNIGGVNYKVILTDSESIPSIGIIKTQKTNLNHAEQKLFSYIQDNYNGQKANVNISVQNTSIMEPGMCIGCGYTSQNFAEMNKNFNVNIFQGSTGANP